MSKIFEVDLRKGTFIENVNNTYPSITGDVTFKQTEKGQAIYNALAGNSNFLQYSLTDDTSTSTGSIVFAFKTNSTSINNALIAISDKDGNRFESYISGGDIRTFAGGTYYTTGGENINDNQWHLGVFTYDGTTRELYIDNIFRTLGAVSTVGTITPNTVYLGRIGSTSACSEGYKGFKYSVYNHILSTTERNNLYKEFLNSKPTIEPKSNFQSPIVTDLSDTTGLVAAYTPSYKTVVGGQLLDISGNGNHGTINGALLTRDGMKFDGVDDKIFSTSNISLGTSFSIIYRGTLKTLGTIFESGGVGIKYTNTSTLNFWYNTNISGKYWTIADSLKEHDYVFSVDSINVSLYQNGILISTQAHTATRGDDGIINIGYSVRVGGYYNGTIQDLKIYNYAFTPQEALAYHNSFTKPVLRDTFKDTAVGNYPKDWKLVSGSGSVAERVIEQGELVTNGGFDGATTGWSNIGGVNSSTISSVAGGVSGNCLKLLSTSTGGGYGYQIIPTVVGHRYKLILWHKNGNEKGDLYLGTGVANRQYVLDNYDDFEWTEHSIEFVATTTTTYINLRTYSGTPSYTLWDNISVVEIPSLPNQKTGDKYLKQLTAGISAIPSKQAYGEWEFDVNKGADWNSPNCQFISGDNGVINTTSLGYRVLLLNDESINLQINNGGTFNYLFRTAISYIANNTWYRLKVARLQSAGVFKDIDTLQVSDLVSIIVPYPVFSSNGRYGFHAIAYTQTAVAGTVDEISITSGHKYLVEYNLKLNSGASPSVDLVSALAGTNLSNVARSVEGKNSHVFTATGTSIGVLRFYTTISATDYEVSNLTIRRIYDAYTFATFIKGGSFGTDSWTLVDPTGGSGTNPVTDSAYTTSEYFVTDLDAGDTFSNLKILNQVNQ